MAGIGFELKKVFDRRSLTGQVMAYGYSAVITAGPFALLTSMVLLIQLLFIRYEAGDFASQLYTASVIYPFVFSQILSSGFVMVLTRYIADCMYQGDYEDVTSSCYGIMLITQAVGAIVAILFYWGKPLPISLKLVTYIFFMEMLAIWIQGVYLTALKDYKSIFLSYLTGVAIAVLLVAANLQYGFVEPVFGAMLSMCIGVGFTVSCFMVQIMRHFGFPGYGLNFEFLPYFEKHYKLFFIALSYAAGIFLANFIIWMSDWGTIVADTYLYAPRYDVLTFYAFISILPTMIMFVVSMELKFYEKYAAYFTYITKKGMYQDIEDARNDLLHTLWQECKNIIEFQLVFSLIFLVAIGYVLTLARAGVHDVNIYRLLVLATFFCSVSQIVFTILLYLEDQRGAWIVTGSFFLLNLIFGIIGQWIGASSYGFTFFLASAISAIIAVECMTHLSKKLNYHVFCSQPVFVEKTNGLLSKIAERFGLARKEA